MVNKVSKTMINEITILKRVSTSHKVELSSIQRRGIFSCRCLDLPKIAKKQIVKKNSEMGKVY